MKLKALLTLTGKLWLITVLSVPVLVVATAERVFFRSDVIADWFLNL